MATLRGGQLPEPDLVGEKIEKARLPEEGGALARRGRKRRESFWGTGDAG